MSDVVPLTVYYDGACPLCRAEISHYRRSRGAERLDFVDVATGKADAGLVAGLDRAAARRRFHVRDADGVLHSGAAAFVRVWKILPRWRWLGRLVDLRLVLPAAEMAYRAFLPLRPHLARLLVRHRGRGSVAPSVEGIATSTPEAGSHVEQAHLMPECPDNSRQEGERNGR